MELPEFNTQKELFEFIHKNQQTIIASKKANLQKSDAFNSFPTIVKDVKEIATKEDQPISENLPDSVNVLVVINTTNFLDSHNDLHLPGIWTKSVQENRLIMHLQEHEMSFENIISDGIDLKVYVKTMSWKELGYNYNGFTEALLFDSKIRKDRNAFMMDQYKKGFVRNHSIGMQYVKMICCINDEKYGAEFEAWNKYYPEIVNKEVADARGYFWAIKEAKVIEGSAVPLGSNSATPTLNVKSEPDSSAQTIIEPSIDTQKQLNELLINLKKINTWNRN
jgi:hypothetical protein